MLDLKSYQQHQRKCEVLKAVISVRDVRLMLESSLIPVKVCVSEDLLKPDSVKSSLYFQAA